MKLKSIINAQFLFFALFAATTNVSAQAYTDGEGAWILKNVEFSPEDNARLVSLLERSNPEAALIGDGTTGRTYGSMDMGSVQMLLQRVTDVQPAALEGWISCETKSIINQCETKNVAHDVYSVADRRVANEITAIYKKYQE